VTAAQAKELCLIARPAKYGHSEQTVFDRRDTWKIPRSRVKIDKRRWNRTALSRRHWGKRVALPAMR
jgi:hypothetical protein